MKSKTMLAQYIWTGWNSSFPKAISVPYQEAQIPWKVIMAVHLQLYFESDQDLEMCCSISVNIISRNSITKLIPNHYLMILIQTALKNRGVHGHNGARDKRHHLSLSINNPARRILHLYSRFHNTSY